MKTLASLIFALTATNAIALERFAVVAGNNEGNGSRPTLWFAERDADRFANTLKELGDFNSGNVRVLHGANRRRIDQALTSLENQIQQVRKSGRRAILLFYFSGHAGAGALELGGDRYEFSTLKSRIESSQADVKVAIVDACESGQLTQVKGARASTELDFAVPNADTTSGVAYIASTAAGEAAQESAALGGSFFTFHLETALRGAGDANVDGQVSLAEAFQYTASRTTTGTSTTSVGPQHPTYNFRMSGRGDVVLSDLRKADATLSLPGDGSALYVISKGGALIAEAAGGLSLALPAGLYRIERRSAGQSWGGSIQLDRGDSKIVPELDRIAMVAVRGKGGGSLFGVSAGFSVSAPLIANVQFLPGIRVAVAQRLGPWAIQLSAGYATAPGDFGDRLYRLHEIDLDLAGLYRLYAGLIDVDAGLRVGGAWHRQEIESAAPQQAWAATGSAVVQISRTFQSLVIGLELTGGGRLIPVNRQLTVRPNVFGTLFVGAYL